jgi:O-antigen ligase
MTGISLIVIALIVTAVAVPSLEERFASIFDGTKDPNQSRNYRLQHMWDGIEIIADHPLLGVGMGQSAEVIGRKHIFTEGHWERIHSLYIEFGADLGLPAIAILVALLVSVIRRLTQTAKLTEVNAECSYLGPYLNSARLSLYTFAIAATFAPATYSWVPYILLGLGSAILAITRRKIALQPGAVPVGRRSAAARAAILQN